MTRRWAMAALDRPSAIRASTSRSRGLSAVRVPSPVLRASKRAITSGSIAVPPAATRRTASTNWPLSSTRSLSRYPMPPLPLASSSRAYSCSTYWGEHQHRQAGHLAPGGQRGPDALVGERRRQPDVDDGHVRLFGGHRGEQVGPVVDGRDDLQAMGLKHARQAVPQQEEVFGDGNAHGISMVTAVGPPGGLLTARTPSNGASRRSIPRSPLPRAGSAPPWPLSVTPIRSISSVCLMSIQACRASACLDTLA